MGYCFLFIFNDIFLLSNNINRRAQRANKQLNMFEYALNIEDLTYQSSCKQYSQKNVVFVSENSGIIPIYTFLIDRAQLPTNFREMSLCLVPMDLFKDEDKINHKDECVFVKITDYRGGSLVVELKWTKADEAKPPKIHTDKKYFVRFIPNRIAFRSCLQTYETIRNTGLSDFFEDFTNIPNSAGIGKKNGEKIEKFEWFNKDVLANQEQMTAIKNIVNCTAYPFPYVVFGPPGTGKTSCIVECIAQILKQRPNVRIIVTAQSNSACDEIGVRLLRHVSWNKVFRLYSPSMHINSEGYEMPEILRRTSNLRSGNSQFPSKEEFSHFRVIIATLMSCSRLIQICDININNHFDYIFVDECGAAMEPESLIPIVGKLLVPLQMRFIYIVLYPAGLGTDDQNITANVVLLGDYKQLGPLISSNMAARMGLSISLMERIMEKDRYKNYDSKYVTQLLDNFRSHPAILQFSNVLFYETKLRAKISEPVKSFGTSWKHLSNKRFPILFHCVKSPSRTEPNGNSYFNPGEIEMVKFYVKLLLKDGINGAKVTAGDIGIVSPYKAQLNMLKAALENVGKVEIGTAEYYQGREKKIIIISTVKSQSSVGFLSSEKRLNVCITRAKSLLILIGNADTLQVVKVFCLFSFLTSQFFSKMSCGTAFFTSVRQIRLIAAKLLR